MKYHYIPEKHIILSQMSIEAQLGDFNICRARNGLELCLGCLFSLNVIVYCWKTCAEQVQNRTTARKEQCKMLL